MATTLFPRLDTLPEYFYHWVEMTPDKTYLWQPYGREWKEITYAQAYELAGKMAQALHELGLQKGDHVAIYSKNCYHWILADLAIMMGGFVSVPLYHNLSAEQLRNVLALSDSKLLFAGKLEKWEAHPEYLPDELKLIHFPHYQGNATVKEGLSWDELIEQHDPIAKPHLPDSEELWTIMFTSGTTGTPKGVMHTHGTPAQILKDEMEHDWIGIQHMSAHRYLSYLPLNHVGEKIGVFANSLGFNGSIAFGESIDTFVQNLKDTEPTLFFAVPRIWTKFYLGVAEKIPPALQKWLFRIPFLSTYLKGVILRSLGLGKVEITATGAAITPAYLKKWYQELGLHLIEAYGMTEVCGYIANSIDPQTPHDSVGQVIPGGEIAIEEGTDEILLHSPYVMKGYYKAEEQTAQILRNGWIYSGDRGGLDAIGNLKVVGRVSDAFKTSKGKYVVPSPIEQQWEASEWIEQICLVGLGIPQPIALINLSEMAKQRDQGEVEEVLLLLQKTVNEKLATFEKVARIVIDTTPWTIENQLITPTLKIRRRKMDETYSARYDEWSKHPSTLLWI